MKKIIIIGLVSVILGILGIILSFNIEQPTGMIFALPYIWYIVVFVWLLSISSICCGLVALALRKYMSIAIVGLTTGVIDVLLVLISIAYYVPT